MVLTGGTRVVWSVGTKVLTGGTVVWGVGRMVLTGGNVV